MFISWIYATLKFYLLDFRNHFQTIAVSTSPTVGTRPIFLKMIEYFRMNIEYLRSASSGSIIKKPLTTLSRQVAGYHPMQ